MLSPFISRPNARTALILLIACVSPCVVSLVVSGCRESQAAAPPQVFSGIPLTNRDGTALHDGEWAGRVLLLNFMFTSCPSVCPRQTEQLAKLRGALPASVRDEVRFLSITVDPENDSPLELDAFARRHGAAQEGWFFARADRAGTDQLTARLAVFEAAPSPTPANHNTAVYLFDRLGRLVQRYSGSPLDLARLSKEVVSVHELKPSRARSAD